MKKIILVICVALLFEAHSAFVKADPGSPADYTVGVDDVLEISVIEPEKIATIATVSPDGAVTFPYIGNVTVKGMTLNTIQETIQKQLAEGYMKYPVVSVTLKESRSRKFFVYGDITKPGVYQLDDNTTILKAISIAGGFSKYGASSMVKVLRQKTNGSYENIDIDIKKVMEAAPNSNIVLQPGDTVTVSEGKFYVYGDVAKPGAYPLEQNTSVLKAISIAGGFLKNDTSSIVKIIRPKAEDSGNETILIDMKSLTNNLDNADIILRSGDTIMVNEGKFYVYGEVNKPGMYAMEGDISVLKAIAMAGGFTKYGNTSRVKVLRLKETGVYETLKVNIKEIMDGAADSDVALRSGDTVVVMEGMF